MEDKLFEKQKLVENDEDEICNFTTATNQSKTPISPPPNVMIQQVKVVRI